MKVYQRPSEELREELKCVDFLSAVSESVYNKQKASESYPVNMLSFAADFAWAALDSVQPSLV